MNSVTLNNGVKMPIIGLGTWKATQGNETISAIKLALEIGMRHIDTARIYGNEESVGQAIKESGIPREEIFVTTKLWNDDHDDVEGAFNESLHKLQLDYVDLYLIHWPAPKRLESWKILEKLYKEGKCKAIGVSNFTIRHLKELLEVAEVVPAVNQVEFSPYLCQTDLHEFCKENGIQLEAYSPLTRGEKLNDPILVGIAQKYDKTPAQVLIQWCVQKEIVVIPKSTNANRIKENFLLDFTIDEDDMQTLNGLHENLRLCWNPEDMP